MYCKETCFCKAKVSLSLSLSAMVKHFKRVVMNFSTLSLQK